MTTLLLDAPAVAGRTGKDARAVQVQHSAIVPSAVPARRMPRTRLALAASLLMALPMLANAASDSYTGYTVKAGQGIPLYIVLAPEGQSASSFLASSEGIRWKDVADNEGARVVVMDGGTTWDTSTDVSALASLYNNQSGIEGASRYMAAYGTAGTTLAAYAAQYPNNIAGAAFINASSSASLTSLTKPQRPLAVLTVNSSGTGMDNFVSHVRTENARGGTEGSNTANSSDLRYYRTGSSAWNRDFSTSHFVRRMSNVATSTDMPSLVHANLFTKVSRWKTVQGNYTLRARVRAGSTGFFKISETVSGSSRDAYVYVPASVRANPGVATPVVMLFHGVTANGNYFIDQTEFNRVADEYGFIVYAPTASEFDWYASSNLTRYRTLISGFGTNGITAGGTNYTVDTRRVYMHGFSNGSYFVSDFAAANGNVLAAAGSWAYTQATSVSGQAIPYWYGVGSLDGGDCPNSFVNAMRTKLSATSTSSISYAALDSANRVATTVYRNSSNGLEARCSIAASVEHGNLNEHSRNLWKDFFGKYRKNSSFTASELIPTSGGNVAPVANFTAVTNGLTATFTDTSTDSDGSIASRAWNFGDGTTSTMANPTKTYSTANTYSVTLTVTDNGGLTGSKTTPVTVSSGTTPTCGGTVLCNGVAVTGLSGAQGAELRYTLQVPAGATNLRFVTSGGSGDADLYIKFGSAPTTAAYDLRSWNDGTNSETINVATAQAGTYHVLVKGYGAFSGASLTGSYTAGTGGGSVQTYTNNVAQALPALSTITSDIAVTGRSGNAPSNATLSVNVTHSYRGDVVIDLIGPSGTVYPVKSSSDDSTDNVIQSYQLNLSSETLNGTWRLRVSDVYQEDAGSLNNWSIAF